MKNTEVNIEQKIEEAKHQLRIEIAKKCLMQGATPNFVISVCSLEEKEIALIVGSLESFIIPESGQNLIQRTDQNVRNEERKGRSPSLEFDRAKYQHLKNHQERRQREADTKRKIAAEETRLLMKRVQKEENEKKEQEKLQKKQDALRRQKLRLFKNNKKAAPLLDLGEEIKVQRRGRKRNVEQNQEPYEDRNALNNQQKTILTVGNCYLKGLSIEDAVLISKATQEEVKQIYNSFKNI